MPLEASEFIDQLNPSWPLGTDGVNTSDDHHRNTKKAVQQSFPNIGGEVTATHEDLNTIAGAASGGSPLVPRAAILPYFGTVAPSGYLICDGAAVPLEYADLIAIIGSNTPDLRGQFLRGWSANASVDPEGPRAPGASQVDMFASHTHVEDVLKPCGTISPEGDGTSGNEKGCPVNTEPTGGAETRPKNIAMGFIIKW
jgi:hypothetical protein